jgi:hypothetical protein
MYMSQNEMIYATRLMSKWLVCLQTMLVIFKSMKCCQYRYEDTLIEGSSQYETLAYEISSTVSSLPLPLTMDTVSVPSW